MVVHPENNKLDNKIVFYSRTSPSPPTHTPTHLAIADTGATSHYMAHHNAPCLSITPAIKPITVQLPNKAVMRNTHEGQLSLPGLPPTAGCTYLFPTMQTSLLSIGQLCDADCTATFDKHKVAINHNNIEVMHGKRNAQSGMWQIELATPNKRQRQAPIEHHGYSAVLKTP